MSLFSVKVYRQYNLNDNDTNKYQQCTLPDINLYVEIKC